MKHSDVIRHLKTGGYQAREIACDGGGRAAVCALGGRVISLRLPGIDENVFWSSSELPKHEAWRKNMWGVTGGIGGERLWFAPEYAYHWMGKRDLVHYTTYQVASQADPGRYQWTVRTPISVSMRARPILRDYRDGSSVSFEVERTISSTGCPIPARGLRFVGVRLQHVLRMRHAKPDQRVDLWHIIQMPAGSRMLIPTVCKPKPLVYANPFKRGSWKIGKDFVTWHYTGNQCAKIGLDASQVTGRAGVLRQMGNGEWAAVIWNFPVMPGANYCDGPDAKRAKQQVSQAWDGFGFGELEYHSPSVGIHDPSYAESSLIWCFAGSLKRVNEIADELLGRCWK